MDPLEEWKIPEKFLERLKDPEVIRSQVEEGKTFRDILGVEEKQMNKFYEIAYNLFQRQEYDRASESFIFLSTLDPYIYEYWLGLGMSEQMIGDFQGALLAYSMAIINDAENPKAHYYSASCYRALDDNESALKSLKMTIKVAGGKDEYKKFCDYALEALAALEK